MLLHPVLRKATELGIGLTAIATLILAGCGGGSSSSAGGGGSVASTTTTVTPYKGRFSSGTVGLTDANGQAVTLTAGGTINASGVASVSFPSSVTYPLTVNVAGTYLDETTGASATMATGSPLMGLIPSASDAAAASGIPVTAVTHIARGMLPASGFSSASAVAAISGAASSVLGVGYSDAMLPPVFNGSGQTSDPTTLKLTALAHVIGQQGGSGDLGARLNNVAASLAAGSAVNMVLPQGNLNNALAALNQIGGASGVVPSGATPPTISSFNPPNASLGNQIQAGIPVCAQGQVLMPTANGLTCVSGGSVTPTPTITGFSPTTGAVGTSVTITGTNLVTGFPPAPTVKFGTTNAGGPYTNVSNTGITFTVPAGLAAGTHTITVGGMSGTPVTVGTFTVTVAATVPAAPVVTPTVNSSTQITLNWAAVADATSYTVYRSTTSGFTPAAANQIAANVAGTSHTDSGLAAATAYFYRVVANNAVGASPASAEVTGTTQAGGVTPPPVVGLMGGSIQTSPLTLTKSVASIASSASGGITTDGTNLYIAVAYNNIIRKVELATGTISTLAGSGTYGTTDGMGTAASFANPTGITTDGTNLYVTDGGGAIRLVVIASGEVKTFAGYSNKGGITTDGNNLYVTNNNAISKIEIATKLVSIVAGSPTGNGFADGVGNAAYFSAPQAITTDGTNLYVADSGNHLIRKIDIATRTVSTVAGGLAIGNHNDAIGTQAWFKSPSGITTDGTHLYVSDTLNHVIRKIDLASKMVTTLAGSPGITGSRDGFGATVDGAATSAQFSFPLGITTDGKNLYVSDQSSIRKLSDPYPASFVLTAGSMVYGGSFHTSTLLPNGKVLIYGGYKSGGTGIGPELYDPATNSFAAISPVNADIRSGHTATLLANGKVLIAGGIVNATSSRTTVLYDPSTNTFAAGSSMLGARSGHSATLLANGKILVAGGKISTGRIASAEIYDPATNSFASVSPLGVGRDSHTATLLNNGKVLIAGGRNLSGSTLPQAELFDPSTNTFSGIPAPSGQSWAMTIERDLHTATLLPNGNVLIAGGRNMSFASLASAELYDPNTNTFTSVAAPMSVVRSNHSATLLLDGKVLLAGGGNTAEVYDPTANKFLRIAAKMNSGHGNHGATLLPSGKVLITGEGTLAGATLPTGVAELFQ